MTRKWNRIWRQFHLEFTSGYHVGHTASVKVVFSMCTFVEIRQVVHLHCFSIFQHGVHPPSWILTKVIVYQPHSSYTVLGLNILSVYKTDQPHSSYTVLGLNILSVYKTDATKVLFSHWNTNHTVLIQFWDSIFCQCIKLTNHTVLIQFWDSIFCQCIKLMPQKCCFPTEIPTTQFLYSSGTQYSVSV